MKIVFALGLLVVTVCAITATGGATATTADRDCSDFASQESAQKYFQARDGSPQNNVDGLDGDGDGRACESLPCPCGNGASGTPSVPAGKRIPARVLRAVDGDTLEVRIKRTGAQIGVRMIGIDTPESKRPGTPVECGARRASTFMSRIAAGRAVTLITDSSQDRFDRYGRLLAYVVRRDGVDLNRAAIRRGWAAVYVYDDIPFTRLAGYERAQARARSEERGVWSLCGGDFHSG